MLGRRARATDTFGVLLLRAVRHVYAHGVGTGREQRFDYGGLTRRRAERGKNLCSPHLWQPLEESF
jgi:hypothetical protein